MSWNYRIVKKYDDVMEQDYYILTEVFYKEDGSLMAYSEGDIVYGDTKQEIIDVLEMMLKDAKKDQPVLTDEDFKHE